MTDGEAPARPARGRAAGRTDTAAPRAVGADPPKPAATAATGGTGGRAKARTPTAAKSAAAKPGRAAAKAAGSTAAAPKPRAAKTPRAAGAKAAEPAIAVLPKRAAAGTVATPRAATRPARKPTPAVAKPSRATASASPPATPAPKRAAAKPSGTGKRSASPAASAKQAAAAGPAAAPARARRAKAPPPLLDRLVAAAVASLEDDKAEDIVVLDVSSRSSFADRMIVASGLSERQLQAMARNLEEALAEAGWPRVRIEASPEWVLLDAGDLVIHLFRPATRETYGIERMWGPESPHG